MKRSLALALILSVLVPVPPDAASAAPACVVQPPAVPPLESAAPPLRFGVAVAGAIMDGQRAVPGTTTADLAALEDLEGEGELIARPYREVFYSEGKRGVRDAVRVVKLYSRAGLEVSLQLRYSEGGDPAGYAAWVAEIVRAVARYPRLTSLEITYEANLTDSQLTSDGHLSGVLDALIQATVSADRAFARLGQDRVELGFVWFYHSGWDAEERLWTYLGREGGSRFAGAVDWVGLAVFPGTSEYPGYLPLTPMGAEAQMVLEALAVMRSCFLPLAGLGAEVDLHIQENSYPVHVLRPEAAQAQALDRTVRAVHQHREVYNVTEYHYFTLRDASSDTGGSTDWADVLGLLRDDYTPKPIFDTYKALIAELGVAPGSRGS